MHDKTTCRPLLMRISIGILVLITGCATTRVEGPASDSQAAACLNAAVAPLSGGRDAQRASRIADLTMCGLVVISVRTTNSAVQRGVLPVEKGPEAARRLFAELSRFTLAHMLRYATVPESFEVEKAIRNYTTAYASYLPRTPAALVASDEDWRIASLVIAKNRDMQGLGSDELMLAVNYSQAYQF